MNIELEQTPNNIHFKICDTTLNQKLDELVEENKVLLRGLKADAKIYDELVFID